MTATYSAVDVPGGLHAGVWRAADSPAGAVVAIHGVTSSHKAFAAVAEALPEYVVVAPDLRGRGRSNGLGGPYGMAQHADDVAELIRFLGLGKVVLVGHSMGGFVSVVLAHRHPDLVDRIVLVDGGIPLELPAGVDPQESIEAVLGPAAKRLEMTFPTRESYTNLWRAHPAFAGTWTPVVEDYIAYDLVGEDGAWHAATPYEALAADTVDLGDPEGSLIQGLDALRTPTVLLQAERGMLDQPEGMYRDG